MSETIRLVLVDDHNLARESLRHMLELESDMEVVGEASNAEEALAKVVDLSPDIVLMDIKMPDSNGLEVTQQLKERGVSARIIILSLYDQYLAQAIEAGAEGYLVKDLKRDELTRAIRRVHNREFVLGDSLLKTPHAAEIALSRLREAAQGKAAPPAIVASPEETQAPEEPVSPSPPAGLSPPAMPPVREAQQSPPLSDVSRWRD